VVTDDPEVSYIELMRLWHERGWNPPRAGYEERWHSLTPTERAKELRLFTLGNERIKARKQAEAAFEAQWGAW
jgi:hypothetical protein